MPTRPDDNDYEKFLATIRPVSLDLSSCTASIDRDLFWKLRENKARRDRREMAARYRINHIGNDYFDVHGEFEITITDPETSNKALHLECSFQAHLHAEKPVNERYATRFAESEFRVVVWPYFRQFVSDTTARMGIPPIFLPIAVRQLAAARRAIERSAGGRGP